VFKVNFVLSAFKGENTRSRSEAALRVLLHALFTIDRMWLRSNPNAPRIYQSGVFYRAEPIGEERWRDIPSVLREGWGDCEDLACWRAAELVEREGVAARPSYTWRRRPGISIYHIVVRLPDGRTEDPSRKLGMGTPEDRLMRRLTGAVE
jgi:hypothetical protein